LLGSYVVVNDIWAIEGGMFGTATTTFMTTFGREGQGVEYWTKYYIRIFRIFAILSFH